MRALVSLFILSLGLSQAQNAVQVSNYLFQGTLNPQRAGSAPLAASNASGNNRFITDSVFGQTRTVYDTQIMHSRQSFRTLRTRSGAWLCVSRYLLKRFDLR